MAQVRTGLAQLPAELLEKVAVFCTGPSLISLGMTCHRLNVICNDFLILRESVGLKLHDQAPDNPKLAELQLAALKQRAQSDSGIWARYFMALGELAIFPELVRSYSKYTVPSTSEIRSLARKTMAFLPQMLALGCVGVLEQQPATLLTATVRDLECKPHELDESTLSKLAFCFAAETMGRPVESRSSLDVAIDRVTRLSILPQDFQLISRGLFDEIYVERNRFFDHQDTKYFLVGLLSQALNKDHSVATPSLDSLTTLSLQSALDLPLPYDSALSKPTAAPVSVDRQPGSQWDNWLRLMETRLVTKEYLEDGEWCGHRTSDPYLGQISGRMEMEHFTVMENPSFCTIASRGRLSSGLAYGISGTIMKADGRFEILQQFAGTYSSRWRGFLTPFGLVGYNQPSHVVHDPTGVFWFWKKPKAGSV